MKCRKICRVLSCRVRHDTKANWNVEVRHDMSYYVVGLCYLRSLKMLPIRFPSQKKTYRAKFLGHLDSYFRFFRKNFNGRYLCYGFSQFPFHGNSISSYSFGDIGMRFAAFYSQLNCAKSLGNRILIFCPINFLEPNFLKKKFGLWKALKNLGAKNQNSIPTYFCAI